MINLNTYLTERLKINKNTVSKAPVYNYHPKDKDELRSLIIQLLGERGEDADLNDIDVSEITDMRDLFAYLSIRNIDISKWNVSEVEDMAFMFYGCNNFNCDLSSWDVSNVENMHNMFDGCKNFNSDFSNWDVSKVEDMENMFWHCISLKNKPSWYHD